MATDFSVTKSIFVLSVVAGCFAVLWPNLFYPMFAGSYSNTIVEPTNQGCCDVMFDSDVSAIKVMIELCEKILSKNENFGRDFALTLQQGKLTNAILRTCQQTVLNSCGVDITEFLIDKVRLGVTYKQMLDGIRSLNSSLCLKHKFAVSFGEIGLPRTIRVWGLNRPKHHHQERPPHLRPDFLHPALREKGRAIPTIGTGRRTSSRDDQVHAGTTVPGIRPPMGGAGHVVPAPKTGSTLGILMPMYTVGIVVFFLYTLMKLIMKKTGGESSYDSYTPDPDFQRAVFNDRGTKSYYTNGLETHEDSKIGRRERDARDVELDMLKRRLQETEEAMERIVAKMMTLPHNNQPVEDNSKENIDDDNLLVAAESLHNRDDGGEEENFENAEDSSKGVVKVLGMEMTESCEKGAKWSRPATPLSRPSTPQNIYIQGALPSQSKLLVSDSHTETATATDNAFVLTGKVTLSLIGVDAENENDSNGPVEQETATSKTGSPDSKSVKGLNENEIVNGEEHNAEVVKEEENSEEEEVVEEDEEMEEDEEVDEEIDDDQEEISPGKAANDKNNAETGL